MLPPTLQELALIRALGKPIVSWTCCPMSDMYAVIGSSIAVAMIWEVL